MAGPMEGIKVVELGVWVAGPAAGGILADWGADVIKVEHPVRGDAQRGFINLGGMKLDPRRRVEPGWAPVARRATPPRPWAASSTACA